MKKDKRSGLQKGVPPSPGAKIKSIRTWAEKAGLAEIANAFELIYYPDIRHSVFHADYTLTDTEFRMIKGLYMSPQRYLTPVVPLHELGVLIDRAFAFCSALRNGYHRAIRAFSNFKDKALPFDLHYKALIEFLFDAEVVSGFRVYWPNGNQSESNRSSHGTSAINIYWEPGGGVNFQVGLYASKPGDFSPLVEAGTEAIYTPAKGRTRAPHWPVDLKPISLA